MRSNIFRTLVFSSAIAIGTLSSCEKTNDEGLNFLTGPDLGTRQFITLTGAFPDAEGESGKGGTRALAISLAEAENPNFEGNVFANGYTLRSQRTARVQGSPNGNFLYNIQYTGDDGGIFNKYHVQGGKNFIDTREEVNTEPILGTAPRWVVAAEGIGVGVYASAKVSGTDEGAGADFVNVSSTAKIAVLNLNDPQITRQTEFVIPFSAEQTKAGYQIGRIDVPVLNAAKNKIFIGCNLTRIDKTKKSTMGSRGQSWKTTTNELGTATLIVDYPSLTNPRLIFSENSATVNHSYRTMTQYVAEDGYIYQATATSGSQILRIDGATGQYDNNYNFDLQDDLGDGVAIKAWRYVKNGIGIALYTVSGQQGGFVAHLDLNSRAATKLTGFDNETDAGFSGLTANENGGTALQGSFTQFQNIGADGTKVYIPLTPNGKDGNLYIVDVATAVPSVKKGAKLKSGSGSFYLGAY